MINLTIGADVSYGQGRGVITRRVNTGKWDNAYSDFWGRKGKITTPLAPFDKTANPTRALFPVEAAIEAYARAANFKRAIGVDHPRYGDIDRMIPTLIRNLQKPTYDYGKLLDAKLDALVGAAVERGDLIERLEMSLKD